MRQVIPSKRGTERYSLFPRNSGNPSAKLLTLHPGSSLPCSNCSRNRAFSMTTEELPLEPPVPLQREHDQASFDCGAAPLNEYLQRFALLNHQNRSARTYVS